jgi:hypothetical protein
MRVRLRSPERQQGSSAVGYIRIPTEQLDGGLPYPAAPEPPRNALLRSLPADEFARLFPVLDRVPLVPRRVLLHAGISIVHLCFIADALDSCWPRSTTATPPRWG